MSEEPIIDAISGCSLSLDFLLFDFLACITRHIFLVRISHKVIVARQFLLALIGRMAHHFFSIYGTYGHIRDVRHV